MTSHSIRIAAVFTWIGFVCAISFMEAWLKFTAPGVSLSVGLAIGQIVFNTLNKVESCLAIIILLSALGVRKESSGSIFFWVAIIVLTIQSIIILPQLSARIDIYLEGRIPEPSLHHTLYAIMELIKVIALFFYGFKQLKIYELNIVNTW